MPHGFHRAAAGITADLAEPERDILATLLTQTADLLQHETGGRPVAVEGVEGVRGVAPTTQEGDVDDFEAMMRRAGFGNEEASAPAGEMPVRSEDPAIQRLLPDAHVDDPHIAAEFRRMTGDAVRDRKLRHLRRAAAIVAASSGHLVLTDEDARSLLIGMTDVRLVLADRLGLDSDEAAEALSEEVATMDQDDPLFGAALGYEFLTWLQETLAVALMP